MNMTMEHLEKTQETANIDKIMRMLPHRYPFLLIDRVQNMEEFKSAVGIKNVTINEPCFQGHFPSKPIFPGVLIIEAMAQAAGVLVIQSLKLIDTGALVYFMTIDETKFRKPVGPGDQIELHVDVKRIRGRVWKFFGKAMVDGQIVAESVYSAMIVDAPAKQTTA